MATLVIDRSKWRRGGRALNGRFGMTALLNADTGLMCCLGFDALACGVPRERLIGCSVPSALRVSALPPDYINTRLRKADDVDDDFINSTLVEQAMRVNDGESFHSDAERECELIPILKQLGWDEVVFVDGPQETR